MHPSVKNTSDMKKDAPPLTESAIVGQAGKEVLVVNTDPEVRLLLHKALFVGSYCSTSVANREEALTCLRKGGYVAVVVSLETPESVNTLEKIRGAFPALPVIAFSRAATPELVRDIMKTGADDFIFGTIESKNLIARLEKILKRQSPGHGAPGHGTPGQGEEGATTEDTPRETGSDAKGNSNSGPVQIICKNSKMERVLEIAGKIAPTDSTVLIQGESGTGKELIARWIHEHNPRTNDPFVEINCGALPENLLESQLFGHEKGSFTGAVHRQLGLFEVADGGTIFLDEIGEMGLDMQVKLLRVLQAREFRRIGGSQLVKVKVRVIAATNRDLKEEVDKGRFRTDLYYRLNVISLELPPLRERREEIPFLVKSFCHRLSNEKGLPSKTFSPEAVNSLQKYSWEGNIRELENAVERLILLCRGPRVEVPDIEEHMRGQRSAVAGSTFSPEFSLDEVKRMHIAKVLQENDGNKMKSARILKINVKTLYNLIRNLEIKY